jgi:hypothetical protein
MPKQGMVGMFEMNLPGLSNGAGRLYDLPGYILR